MNMDKASVLNHLMFHKALISENDEDERINRYLQIIENMDYGLVVGIKWDINIAEFTKMYLARVRKDDYVNFVTAGRLILMAWSVLKLQSEKVLVAAIPPEPVEESDWMDAMDVYDAPEDLDFTHTVMRTNEPPLQEYARNQPTRPVTLMELVNAFDAALQDAATTHRRQTQVKFKPPNFHVNVHKEDLNEDLELTWNRILQFNGSAIPLHNLCTEDAWDIATVFMAVLFLAKMKKIKLWQRHFPYGEIFVKRANGSTELSLTELVKEAATESQEGDLIEA
jgi:segregation and condensation protein A